MGFSLPENVTSSAIHAVSLSTNPCEYGSKARLLPEETKSNEFKNNFTICLSPVYGLSIDANYLVNFIEMHRLLGVNKIAVYNMSTSSEVAAYLEMYKFKGIVDIYQWHLPKEVDSFYHAQAAMLSDCLYRYMYQTRYIAFVDPDEIIVPRNHTTWNDLMIELEQQTENQPIAGFSFKNILFNVNWEDDSNMMSNPEVIKFNILPLLKTKRDVKDFRHNLRSKLIVNPRRMQVQGLHIIQHPLSGYKSYHVPNDTAVMFHYRSWPNTNSTLDRTMHIYYTALLERIAETHRNFQYQPQH